MQAMTYLAGHTMMCFVDDEYGFDVEQYSVKTLAALPLAPHPLPASYLLEVSGLVQLVPEARSRLDVALAQMEGLVGDQKYISLLSSRVSARIVQGGALHIWRLCMANGPIRTAGWGVHTDLSGTRHVLCT